MSSSQLEILKLIKKIITENEDITPKIPVNDICGTTSFQNDLGFDSLSLMAITYEVQESYTQLNEEQMSDWKVVNDLIEAILKLS